jgi:hypothetical protein
MSFSILDDHSGNGTYPSSSTDPNALGLSNPDSVLSGTNRGTQNLGSPNIRSEPQNTRIVVDDNTTNRVSFGKIGSGANDWGLKVSKPTYNVDTATADQLIFNSSQNVFKIADTKVISLTVTASGGGGGFGETSLAHGLSFTPAYYGSITLDNAVASLSVGGTSNLMTPALTYGLVGGVVTLFSISAVSVDSTNIKFNTQLGNSVPNGTYTFLATVDLLQKTFS